MRRAQRLSRLRSVPLGSSMTEMSLPMLLATYRIFPGRSVARPSGPQPVASVLFTLNVAVSTR